MTKVKCVYKDGSSITYTIKTGKEHLVPQYANEHVDNWRVESITVQKYPLKDNQPIDWLKQEKERRELQSKS